jgi:predicted nucleic acid-binding Zn ribbon protein
MSGFEFLVVLLSIVFGLALTQLLSGAVRVLNEERVDALRLIWAGVLILMVIINWWGFIGWGDLEEWHFGQYAFLMIWASAHYAMAATLFPDREIAPERTERQRRTFLVTLLVTCFIDVGEAALRGPLSSDMPYLVSMIVWCLGVIAALIFSKPWVERVVAGYFLVSVIAFALAERSTFHG